MRKKKIRNSWNFLEKTHRFNHFENASHKRNIKNLFRHKIPENTSIYVKRLKKKLN